MSLLLNESDLIESVVENVPVERIELILRGVGREHFERLLFFIAEKIKTSPHLEFYMEWFLMFSKVHGGELEKNMDAYVRPMRAIGKAIGIRAKDLKESTGSNGFGVDFLLVSLEHKQTL